MKRTLTYVLTCNILKPYLLYRHVSVSPNDFPEFPSAALLSVNDAAASPLSAALQTENSFCVIWLKGNVSAHQWFRKNGRSGGQDETVYIDKHYEF
ncbi:MAG: hypothetical protein HFG75_15600 [Hungatella sp.]|nr:hypothetical protein [Hungatella sp.]